MQYIIKHTIIAQCEKFLKIKRKKRYEKCEDTAELKV